MKAERLRQILDAELRKRRAVVLQAYPSRVVLESMQALVAEVSQSGGHVVLLIDAPRRLVDPELMEPWQPLLKGALVAERFHEGTAYLGTVSHFIDVLRDREHEGWIDRIGLLLLPRGEDLFTRPYIWELMAFALRDRFTRRLTAQLPRTVVILEPRRAPESAVREALPIYATESHAEREAWSEYRVPIEAPEAIWWTVWSSEEVRGYLSGLGTHGREFVGAVAPLAQFAGRWGVPEAQNLVFSADDNGDLDNLQNLQKSVGRLLFSQQLWTPWRWLQESPAPVVAVTLRERQGNPWRGLHRVAAAFNGTTLCNVVSRCCLLEVYQLANAGAFAVHPLLPISPVVSLSRPFDTASQLVQRLDVAGALDAEVVRNTLVSTMHPGARDDPDVIDVFGGARALVEEQLGPGIAAQLRWEERDAWVAMDLGGRFERVGSLQFDRGTLARAEVNWLDEFIVADDAGTVFDAVRREHVLQRYWTGKIVPFHGQKFVVSQIDERSRRVRVAHDDRQESPEYRPQRKFWIGPSAAWMHARQPRAEQMADGSELRVDAFRLDFSVESTAVVVSLDHWASEPYVKAVTGTSRQYRQGRAARLRLVRGDESLLSPEAAVALAAWLNEAAPTLLPEVANFLAAVPQVADDARPRDRVASLVLPALVAEEHDATPAVWIFEDSQSDLGIMRAVVEDIWYLLDVCFDWLNWTLEESGQEPRDRACLYGSIHGQRDWFAFGMSRRDSAIGLEALWEALRPYKARFREVTPHRRNASAIQLVEEREAGSEVECDFCGKTTAEGRPFKVLDDGRISCEPCAEVGVVRVQDVEKMFHEVSLPFFREALGVVDVTNVRVELVNQAHISNARGRRFIPTSGLDMRVVGLAMKGAGRLRSGTASEQERHVVMLESGFSPEATANTLVHELCHIWQYNHLDLEAMQPELCPLYLEGHAVWTEEQFLQWVLGREFAQFDKERWSAVVASHDAVKDGGSVYGEGYRLLTSHLPLLRGSAFEWLRQKFGKL